MGRPTLLTPERQAKIVELLRGGNYIETAVTLAGINKQTHYNWINRAQAELNRLAESTNPDDDVAEEERIFVDYLDAVTRARAEAEAANVAVIQRAARGYEVRRVRTFKDQKGEITKIEEITFREHKPELALDFLERSFPDRWKRQSRHETVGDGGGPVQVAATVQYIMPDNGRDPKVGARPAAQPERQEGGE